MTRGRQPPAAPEAGRTQERSPTMAYVRHYAPETATRDDIDVLPGATVLEFGTNWCGFCTGAQPAIEAALSAYPDMRHLKVEDGSGRPLGRSFRIKLWPTLVLLRDGEEVARVVRPSNRAEVDQALALLEPPAGDRV